MTHPHWDMVLTQCGRGLDSAIVSFDTPIGSGQEYLTMWIASLLQDPELGLPYLFFYGPQNCGKSMFNEALSLLLRGRAIPADLILMRPFNSELENATFCWLEEADIHDPEKLALLTEYVTKPFIRLRTKGGQLRHIRNNTHWCQTSGDLNQCPSLPEGWITTIPVPELDVEISKKELLQRLHEESVAFTQTVLSLLGPQPFFTQTLAASLPILRGIE